MSEQIDRNPNANWLADFSLDTNENDWKQGAEAAPGENLSCAVCWFPSEGVAPPGAMSLVHGGEMSGKERAAWMARVKGIADHGEDKMEFKLSDIDLEMPPASSSARGRAASDAGSDTMSASSPSMGGGSGSSSGGSGPTSSLRTLSPGVIAQASRGEAAMTPEAFCPAPGPAGSASADRLRGRRGSRASSCQWDPRSSSRNSGSCTPSSLASSLSAMQQELDEALDGKAGIADFPDEMRSDDAIDAMIRSLKNPYCAQRASSAYGSGGVVRGAGSAPMDADEQAYQEAIAPVPAPAPASMNDSESEVAGVSRGSGGMAWGNSSERNVLSFSSSSSSSSTSSSGSASALPANMTGQQPMYGTSLQVPQTDGAATGMALTMPPPSSAAMGLLPSVMGGRVPGYAPQTGSLLQFPGGSPKPQPQHGFRQLEGQSSVTSGMESSAIGRKRGAAEEPLHGQRAPKSARGPLGLPMAGGGSHQSHSQSQGLPASPTGRGMQTHAVPSSGGAGQVAGRRLRRRAAAAQKHRHQQKLQLDGDTAAQARARLEEATAGQGSASRLPDTAEQRASLPSSMADEDCKQLKSGRPLPASTTKMLREWLLSPQLFNFPWPDEPVKQEMARRARITVGRLNVWLTNGRKRLWAPLRRQMGLPVLNYSEAKKRRQQQLLEEQVESAAAGSNAAAVGGRAGGARGASAAVAGAGAGAAGAGAAGSGQGAAVACAPSPAEAVQGLVSVHTGLAQRRQELLEQLAKVDRQLQTVQGAAAARARQTASSTSSSGAASRPNSELI